MEFLRLVSTACFLAAVLMGLHWLALVARSNLVVRRLQTHRPRANAYFNTFVIIAVVAISSVICGTLATGREMPAYRYILTGYVLLMGLLFHFVALWVSTKTFKDKSRGAFLYRYWLDGDSDRKWMRALHASCIYAHFNQVWIAAAVSMFTSLSLRAQLDVDPRHYDVEIAASMVTAVSFTWVVHKLTLFGRLGRRLTTACFADWFDPRASRESDLKISRWRNSEHRQMFQIATAIERCLPQLRQRLSSSDYQDVVASYLGLTSMLRECVLRASNPALRMDVLRWAAVALVLNDDPVLAARRLKKFVNVDKDASLPERGRLTRAATGINRAIESAMKPVGALAAISIVGYYMASGQHDILLNFVKSLLGAP